MESRMTKKLHGRVRGKTIELVEDPGVAEGQEVELQMNVVSAAMKSLRSAGHDAVHVREVGLQHDDDMIIFNRAEAEDRIVVSADTDFGLIHSSRAATRPSVLLFRKEAEHRPELQIQLPDREWIRAAIAGGES
jgi:predicted nuclease of predicted toxin-antitoxin system